MRAEERQKLEERINEFRQQIEERKAAVRESFDRNIKILEQQWRDEDIAQRAREEDLRRRILQYELYGAEGADLDRMRSRLRELEDQRGRREHVFKGQRDYQNNKREGYEWEYEATLREYEFRLWEEYLAQTGGY